MRAFTPRNPEILQGCKNYVSPASDIVDTLKDHPQVSSGAHFLDFASEAASGACHLAPEVLVTRNRSPGTPTSTEPASFTMSWNLMANTLRTNKTSRILSSSGYLKITQRRTWRLFDQAFLLKTNQKVQSVALTQTKTIKYIIYFSCRCVLKSSPALSLYQNPNN